MVIVGYLRHRILIPTQTFVERDFGVTNDQRDTHTNPQTEANLLVSALLLALYCAFLIFRFNGR